MGRPRARGLEGTRPKGHRGPEGTCLSAKIAGGYEPKGPPGAQGPGGYVPKPQNWRKVKRQETWMIPPNQVRSPRTPLGETKREPYRSTTFRLPGKIKIQTNGSWGTAEPDKCETLYPAHPPFSMGTSRDVNISRLPAPMMCMFMLPARHH